MSDNNNQANDTKNTEHQMFSALMERFHSAGFASLEQVNITLQDAVLRELGVDDRHGDIRDMRTYLTESMNNLDGFKETIKKFKDNMKKNGYQDLAKELKIDVTKTVVRDLAKVGLARSDALNEIAGIMKNGGYQGVLTSLDQHAVDLLKETRTFGAKIDMLEKHASDGQLTTVLEQNLPGNIKTEFARLYTHWNTFSALFHASNAIHTELWYRYSGVKSLIG